MVEGSVALQYLVWRGIHGRLDPDFDALPSFSTTNFATLGPPSTSIPITDRLSQLLAYERVWQTRLTSEQLARFTRSDIRDLNYSYRLSVLDRPDGPIPAVFLGDTPPLASDFPLDSNDDLRVAEQGIQVGPDEESTGTFAIPLNLLVTKDT